MSRKRNPRKRYTLARMVKRKEKAARRVNRFNEMVEAAGIGFFDASIFELDEYTGLIKQPKEHKNND